MNLSWLALVGICLAVTLRGTQGAVDIAQWGGTGDDNLNGMATLRGSADSLRGIDFVVVGSTLSDDIDNVNTDGDLGGLDGFAARLDNVTLAPVWMVEFGTEDTDSAIAVATTDDGVIVVGSTEGDLDGNPNAGLSDAFVRKMDLDTGDMLWSIVFGTTASDAASAVTVDVDTGDIYVAGWTDGDLDGGIVGSDGLGGRDMFLSRISPLGIVQWITQFGGNATDSANAVTFDPSGPYVYVAGESDPAVGRQADAYVAQFTDAGQMVWSDTIGTDAADYFAAVVVDGSDVYAVGGCGEEVAGFGGSYEGASDLMVVHYLDTGVFSAGMQAGGDGFEVVSGAMLRDGALVVSGDTSSGATGMFTDDLIGGTDLFVANISLPVSGDATAFRLGTDGDDFGDGLAEDRCGRVVAAGSTTGAAVDGDDSEGGLDIVVYIFGGAFPTNPDCIDLIDEEPLEFKVIGPIMSGLAVFLLIVIILGLIAVVGVRARKVPWTNSNKSESVSMPPDEELREVFDLANLSGTGTITFDQAFVVCNTVIPYQLDHDDAKDIHEFMEVTEYDYEHFKEFFARLNSGEAVAEGLSYGRILVTLLLFLFIPFTMLSGSKTALMMRKRTMRFVGFPAKIRRGIYNSSALFWMVWVVYLLFWLAGIMLMVAGFVVQRGLWGNTFVLDTLGRRGYFTGPEVMVPILAFLATCLLMTTYMATAEKNLERERVRVISDMSTDTFTAVIRETKANDVEVDKLVAKAKSSSSSDGDGDGDGGGGVRGSGSSHGSSNGGEAEGGEGVTLRRRGGSSSSPTTGTTTASGTKAITGDTRLLIAYIYGTAEVPLSLFWKIYGWLTSFGPPILVSMIPGLVRLIAGLPYFGYCVGASGSPPPPFGTLPAKPYNCTNAGDAWSVFGAILSSVLIYFYLYIILYFLSFSRRIYESKYLATKRLVDTIDPTSDAPIFLDLDDPANVVAWSQARLFVHAFNSLQVKRLDAIAGIMGLICLVFASVIFATFLSPLAALDTYVLFVLAAAAFAILAGYIVYPTLFYGVKINQQNTRVPPLLHGLEWELTVRSFHAEGAAKERIKEAVSLLQGLILQIERFPAVFRVLYVPVNVATVTSVVTVLGTAIASFLASYISSVVQEGAGLADGSEAAA